MEDENKTLDILQPEILSKGALLIEINKRKLKIENPEQLSKEALVEIFYKNVVPMPQRTHRQNRRGKQMTKKQVQSYKRKRKFDQVSCSNELHMGIKPGQSSNSHPNSRFMSSYTPPSSGSRIKPPPTAVNFERKLIKLGKSSSNSSSSEKDNHNISHKHIHSDTPVKKPDVIHLGTPKVTNVVKESNDTGNIEIKTIVKDVITPSTDSQDKVTVKITKIMPQRKSTLTKIRLKRPDPSSRVETDLASCNSNGSSVIKQFQSEAQASESPSTDEDVIRKKFRRIDIQFP